MNKEQFIEEFSRTLDSMKATMLKKNADYAGYEDPFKNFRLAEILGVATTAQGLIVRMTDKLSRIAVLTNSMEGPKVEDERIIDTLEDLANYAIIMKLFLLSNK